MKTITFDETKWKLVPVEPTEEMVNAGNKARLYREDGDLSVISVLNARTYNTKQAWAAQLAAAPQVDAVSALVPLTDEQITGLLIKISAEGARAESPSEMFAVIARAIERAHGIGQPASEGESE